MSKIDKKRIAKIAGNVVYPLIALGAVIAIWAIIAKVKDNALVFPMPSAVFSYFFKLGGEQGFWISVGMSLARTLICFAIAFVCALLLSAIGGLFLPFHKVMSPVVSVLRSAPTVAVILILYVFMDNSSMSVVVGFLVAFPIMYSAFYGAITGVDKELSEMARVYEISAFDKVRSIYLPSIAPCLFDTSKSTVSLTFKVIVAAEIIAGVTKSIGGKIQTANAGGEIAYLLAWTIVAIVFGFVLEGIVALFKKLWEVLR